MKKIFILVILVCSSLILRAQTQPFGVIDTADLKLTTCDFEKGANAMVLFDKADVYYKFSTVVMERHKRIKILNDKGTDEAKVRIEYFGAHRNETVTDIEAQTINLGAKGIEYTPVDKSLIYRQDIDKDNKAIIFTFSNVKPGSVVEFKYKWSTPYAGNLPDWSFQSTIPTRYSEIQCDLSKDYVFKYVKRVNQKFAKDTIMFKNGKNYNQGARWLWALNNVHTIKDEPYMSSISDNTQAIIFQVSTVREMTWLDVIGDMMRDEDFGRQMDSTAYLNGQDEILAKTNALKTQDEKIAYIFNSVKNTIKWNKYNNLFTDDGVKKAWNKKTGNAAEVNLILYHLLKASGMNVYAMAVNTDGKVDLNYATWRQLNKVVDYIRVDSTKQFILDATDKNNFYDEVPFYLLNSNGLVIDPKQKTSRFIPIQNDLPQRDVVFINAEITHDGKMNGTAQINNFSYNRVGAIKKYKDDGEKKYKDYLRDDDNSLKISAFKLENMEVDSLPLTQNVDFSLDLTGSDDNYIYFNPNFFSGLNTNPFISEERFSNIDFKYLHNYTISGRYKLPAGYKVEALPKSLNFLMPDSSISMKRIVAEQDGYIIIHYNINFKRSYYLKEEYGSLRTYYKKMYEMLNEQIILKKG